MIKRFLVKILPQQWAVLALCVAIAGIYLPTFQFLNVKWSAATQAYSHGYLIVAICAFLLVRAALSVRQQSSLPLLGLLGLILSNAIWMLAYFANTMVIQAMMIPVCAYFLLITVFGRQSATVWITPVSFFYFAVPFWDYGNDVLQAMTIFVSTSALDAIEIPAVIDGSFVYLARGTFEIAAGCSGLHFFIVALALASIYSTLYLNHRLSKVWLLLMAAVGSIVMNWIRVTTIIVAGYYSDMQHYLVTVDHYYFGWALFAAMLIPLFLVARKFEIYEAVNESGHRRDHSNLGPSEIRSLVIAVAVGIGVAAAIPFTNYLIVHNDNSLALRPVEGSLQLSGWIHSEVDSAMPGIRFEGAQSSLAARFHDEGNSVMLYANNYGKQAQGAELISSNNNIFDRSQWRVTNSERIGIGTGAATVSGLFLELSNRSNERRVLYYWYVVNGESLVDPLMVKIREVFSRFYGNSSSGIRVLTSDCSGECESSRKIIESIVREHGQQLNQLWVPGGKT